MLTFSRLLIFAIAIVPTSAYSVLTHEAIIDAVWESNIRPLLLAKYPKSTPEEVLKAHAYAYGGCLGQDMGYAPFSARLWSDLTHYVRSGDLVKNMLRDAQDIDEYAYALGALAHYTADRTGHPTINRITALSYPKLRAKFGDVVTYEDAPAQHLKTEFALDVVQVARQGYAPDAYHAFIGYEIAQSLMERAFHDTYGLELKDLFLSEDLAIGTYRFSVGKLIPEMSKVAWNSKRKDIQDLSPGVVRSRYVYTLSRRQYEKEWGTKYSKPGIGARILSFTFRLIPTVGPFKALGFKPVTAEGEKMFLASFDATVTAYRGYLQQVRTQTLKLSDTNLDTGELSSAGAYRLGDEAYVKLLDKLANSKFKALTPELQADILDHFKSAERAPAQAKDAPKLENQLAELRELKAGSVPE